MQIFHSPVRHIVRASAVLGISLACLPSAHALFEDAEARRAILELRQRFDASAQENAQMRRSLLDLQAQIETLRSDLARLRGQNEQLAREASEIQRTQNDLVQGVDERLSRFEPAEVQVDGLRFIAQPQERNDFEVALEQFRAGDFATARKSFAAFINTYKQSGYIPSARFWLANTQYAARDYKNAVQNYRAVVNAGPQHERAAEAALSLANCQIELKDTKAARQVLQALLRDYPGSEAAATGKQLLDSLK
ncbi:tol-pal system protein YbgF [Comamonas nitrativorans]|uniref:Cell division coordinator CpoB n=1 Tax=Comamonas nitrativorans TaxID=108437 RepID=A0ABV9GVJ0_9BURK